MYMMEIDSHKKALKLVAIITILSVVIFFLFIPVMVFGDEFENTTDTAVNNVDTLDGQDNFTPGKIPNQSMSQKVMSAF